jgi:lipopolysaccharide transport system permease protein
MTTTTEARLPAPDLAPSPARARLLIEPPSSWAALNLRELWHFRELLWNLAIRDVKLRYRQTVLGVSWVILQPLSGAAIFAFVFGKIAGFKAPVGHAGETVPYLLFALSGMICWQTFSGTLTRTSNSMVGNAHLVSKVYFPRVVLPLATLSSTLLDFVVTLAFLAVLLVFQWHLPGASILLLPVCVLMMCALSLGIGLAATALAVSYRDVQFIVPVMTQLLLYLSPVAYSVERVPLKYRELYFLNPLASILEAFRWSLLSVGEVRWAWFAYSGVVSLLVLFLGAYAFSWMERNFADVV